MKKIYFLFLLIFSTGIVQSQNFHNPDIISTITKKEILDKGQIESKQGSVILLNFEGLGNVDNIEGFYDGGSSSRGYSGTDYGVYFNPDALSIIASYVGGSGNFQNEPSPSTVLFFLEGSAAIMNVRDGFEDGFSFYYSSIDQPGYVEVYDDFGGTGNILATLDLEPLGKLDIEGGAYNIWKPIGVEFGGIAKSVAFGGVADRIGFDDVTFGSATPLQTEIRLSRIISDDEPEDFIINKHSWGFGNNLGEMWQDGGLFPSWDLFCDAFGDDQCYYLGLPIKRYNAWIYWELLKNILGDWSGSCGGFAISTYLAFDRKDEFVAKYQNLPEFNNLIDLPRASINEIIRNTINQLMLHQFGFREIYHYSLQYPHITPSQTLKQIIYNFENNVNDNQYLLLWDMLKARIHAVNPYKVKRDDYVDNIWYIYISDSNEPFNETMKVTVDIEKNKWSYLNDMGIGFPESSRGLFLSRPVSNFLNSPRIPGSIEELGIGITFAIASGLSGLAWDHLTKQTFQDEIFNKLASDEDEILFPIIPITSREEEPIGFITSKEKFSFGVNNQNETANYFGIISNNKFYYYERGLKSGNGIDMISYNDNGIGIKNPEITDDIVHIDASQQNGEEEQIKYTINYKATSGDSIFIKMDETNLIYVNSGDNKSYDLSYNILNDDGEYTFTHTEIIINNNSRHIISPREEDLANNELKIYIDNDNNGIIDDSTKVVNQVTNIAERRTIPDNIKIYQNYPNPFNPSTTIKYTLPERNYVSLSVYNTLGQKIAKLVDDIIEVGTHKVTFDASHLPSGVYIYRLHAGEYVESRKMLYLK